MPGRPLSLAVPKKTQKKKIGSYYVFVMRSKKTNMRYVGSSPDPQESLQRHNFGDYRATNSHRPWKLVMQEEFPDKPEAVKREWFLKGEEGQEFLNSVGI